jgi:hypothetical protein
MSPKYTSRIVVATVFMLAAFCAVRSLKAQGVGTLLLEDFSSMRMNHDSPPYPLWSPYANGAGGPDFAGQVGDIENGTYHIYAPGRPYFQFLPYPYVDPYGFAKDFLRSGTWNPNVNRLTFWVKNSQNIARNANGGELMEFGTYTKKADGQVSNQGAHYYHILDPNMWAGRWMLVTINRVPQHQVGGGPTGTDPNPTYPENPTSSSGFNYFDGLTRFYLYDGGWGSASSFSGDWYYANFQFGLVTGEPDTLVSTTTAVYTGDHYELSWQGPRNVVQKYNVYMSTASMKGTGVGSGTLIGTTQNSGDTYTGVFIASKAVAQPSSGMYFAINPQGQSAFTEIYLPATIGAPSPPSNVHIVH